MDASSRLVGGGMSRRRKSEVPEDVLGSVGLAPEPSTNGHVPHTSEGHAAQASAREHCKDLTGEADITAEFARTLAAAGVAGETKLIRLLYLALTSRRLDKPVSVAVKGPSSGGKSHLVE